MNAGLFQRIYRSGRHRQDCRLAGMPFPSDAWPCDSCCRVPSVRNDASAVAELYAEAGR